MKYLTNSGPCYPLSTNCFRISFSWSHWLSLVLVIILITPPLQITLTNATRLHKIPSSRPASGVRHWMQLPVGRRAPGPGTTSRAKFWVGPYHDGHEQEAQPGPGWAGSSDWRVPWRQQAVLRSTGQVVIPGKFPGQVLSLPETSHSFPVCFTVQWLTTSRMKVTAQFVKNTHPIISWNIFILYFPGCK